MSARTAAAALLLLSAAGLAVVGQPGSEARLERMQPELDRALAERKPHIDPAELLGLMYNNQLLLILLDVRDEADFNLFHLEDALWRPLGRMDDRCCRKLKADGIKVVMSNDEARAEAAWKHLVANGVLNVYILAGGINLWLDIYRDQQEVPPLEELGGGGDDRLRHSFAVARGHHDRLSLPDVKMLELRSFDEKVEVVRPVVVEGGGCG